MGRQVALESPSQRPDAGARVDCISGNCCDPSTFPATWDMNCIRCIFCPDDAQVLADASTQEVKSYDSITYHDYLFENGQWVIADWPAGGDQGPGKISMEGLVDCDAAANTLYHEVRHLNQPAGMSTYDAEYDAYFTTEEWTIQKGLRDVQGLRKTDEHGNEVPNPAAIDRLVRELYLGAPADGPLPTEEAYWIRVDPPETQWKDLATGALTWRPSQEGDYVRTNDVTKVNERTIAPSEFTCDG